MKKIMNILLALCLVAVWLPTTFVEASTEPGKYQITYQVNAADSSSASYGNDYFLKPATLIVNKDGSMTAQITIKNSSWVTEFQSTAGGNKVLSTNSGADTRVVQFNVPTLNSPLKVKIKVDIAELSYHHNYTIDFAWYTNTLKLIESYKEPEVATPAPAPAQTAQTAPAQTTQATTKPVSSTDNNESQQTPVKQETKKDETKQDEAKQDTASNEQPASASQEVATANPAENENTTEQTEVNTTEEEEKESETTKTAEEAQEVQNEQPQADESSKLWLYIVIGIILIAAIGYTVYVQVK